ncbi:MAG: FG-GAP-like repeat-containing protein [Planctomycetota bacterium]
MPAGSNNQSVCVVADFDGDGRDDFVVGSRYSGGRVELFRFDGSAWRKDTIEPSDVSPEAGGATADIDGDGDLDLVIGQDWVGNEIYWWENPRPNFGSPWTRRVVKSGGAVDHHDQAFGDVDGDGRPELVSWTNFTDLTVFEIPSDPRNSGPWSSTVIFRSRGQAEGAAVADIDGDGVLDIVAAGRWFKSQGGGVFAENVIDSALQLGRVAVGQIVPGGRPEVVLLPGHSSGEGAWYWWTGSFWARNSLGYFTFGHTVAVADLDGDGHQDILTGEMKLGGASCRLRVHYGDGNGNLSEQLLSTGNDIHEGHLADVDGDGDLDIVHKPMDDRVPRIELWLNPAQGSTRSWRRHQVDGSLPQVAVFVVAGDLDGDGLADIAGGDAWYRNPGSLGGAWTRSTIGWPLNNVAAIHDFDGDGDLDLFGTQGQGANADPRMAWAENDGAGHFTVRTNIPTGVGDFLQGVAVARFGGSGSPLQIALSWHYQGNGVQMLTLPQDPRNQQWSWQTISSTDLKEDLDAGDIDGDGDLDLLLGTHWLECPSWQTHVLGYVGDLTSVGTPEPDRNELVDIDRDGDLDAVVGLENGREILWFENPRPQQSATSSWPRHILAVIEGQGFSLDTGDIDRDGDADIVLGEHRGSSENRVIILENNGTTGNWPQQVIDSQPAAQADHHDGTQLLDMDNDGDLDIYSTGWLVPKIWVYEAVGGSGGTGAVGPVSISPPGGAFELNRRVTLSVPTHPSATIHYTLDGNDPTQSSPQYNGPLDLSWTAQLRARAFQASLQASPVATADFAQIADHLGRWRLDGGVGSTVVDDSVQGHDGRIVGASWAAGADGFSLQFDGQNQRVEVGSFDVQGSALTIACWVYVDRFDHLPLQDARFVSKARSTWDQDHYWMLSSYSDGQPRLRFRLRTWGNTTTLVADRAVLPAQTWVHVAATYDGSTMRLWQNGEEVGAVAKSGPIDTDPTVPVWFGDSPTQPGSRPFAGRIDDVRLLARAASVAELRALAAERALDGVSPFGVPQRTCNGAIRVEANQGSSPASSRSGFVISSLGAPPSAFGALVIGLTPVATPWLLNGATMWLQPDPAAVLPVWSGANGSCQVPLSLTGLRPRTQVVTQFVWTETAGCGTPGRFVGSHAALLQGP